MKITIIHCHWNNRGDEAAIRAMVDELLLIYPNAEIYIQILVSEVKGNPFDEKNIHVNNVMFPKRKNRLDYWITYLSKGRISFLSNTRNFLSLVKGSDIVLHGPGGPSIGDIYLHEEMKYLKRLDLVRRMGIKYAFYAPSMGPFNRKDEKRNRIRKRVLNGAEFICLREMQSAEFVRDFGIPENKITVTLDSAFQHFGNVSKYSEQLNEYADLSNFLDSYERVVGVTTTNLKWHPIHKNDPEMAERIKKSFDGIIEYFKSRNIGVLFVPQLFGQHHDLGYMKGFAQDNCFVMDEVHDCYFQQYVISKLHAVIGMRYHSNIFSAKMSTPFISVAYEQKMSGFMEISGLRDYCIDIHELSADKLVEKFELLENHYEEYKQLLVNKREEWVSASHRTTDLVCERLGK